mgnify:CR=1 FL=1
MACIIYQTNKKTGIKYAYRSESYRDPETKKPKSRRTYLGRVDPITNEIIPKADTGKRNRSPIASDSVSEKIQSELREKNNTIKQLERQVSTCKSILEDLKNTIDSALDKLPDA